MVVGGGGASWIDFLLSQKMIHVISYTTSAKICLLGMEEEAAASLH